MISVREGARFKRGAERGEREKERHGERERGREAERRREFNLMFI